MGAVSELLGCSQKFGDVAIPPSQLAEELCCLARPVPAWISGSHAWLSQADVIKKEEAGKQRGREMT